MSIVRDDSAAGYSDIFNDNAAQYHKAFPWLTNVMISSATKLICATPDIAEHLSKNVNDVKQALRRRMLKMRQLNAVGMVGPNFTGRDTLHISFRLKKIGPVFVSSKFPFIMNLLAVLDHEFGHRICPTGSTQKFGSQIAECTADAFAVLRHLQRFQGKSDIFEHNPFNRARMIVLKKAPYHYTSGAVQYIERLYKQDPQRILSMSLEETAQLTEKIALQYRLPDETLKKVHEAYSPAQELAPNAPDRKKDWNKIIRTVVQVMLENKDDHDIYRAGRQFLQSPLTQKYIRKAAKTDPSIMDIFEFMEPHEKASGFILNAADAMDAKRTAAKKPMLQRTL